MKEQITPVVQEYAKKAGDCVIEDVYREFIKPQLLKIKNKPKDAEIIFDLLKEYLEESYKRNRYMNTIVFNRETKTIDDLYIPLTLIKNGKTSREKIFVDENISNFFIQKNRILVIDTAGMGKSTLAKYLYLKCLEKNFGIPFLIELRKLEGGKNILEYISNELCLCRNELNENDIKFIIEQGEFIFFLDGYDEIPKENKDIITEEIKKFVLKYYKNSFMLTSREDEAVNMFSEFEKFHIKPLEKQEAYDLIRKYDNKGEISEKLIKEIETNDQYDVLEEFLENPLMVSLLYSSYHYKGIIQYKKHLFYRQVYDALYEGHDITKGSGLIHTKKSKLDVEDFNRLLSIVGYLSIKGNRISFSRHELIELINKSIELFRPREELYAADFLDDLLHAVPIFIKESLEYKWSHKSFAEYYAAYFICLIEKEHERQIIKSIMKASNNTNYQNVLDFCYDMDPKVAREVILYDLISDFIKYCDENPVENGSKSNILHRYYMFIDTIRFVKTKENIEGTKKGKKNLETGALIEAIKMLNCSIDDPISFFNVVSRNYNVFMFVTRKPAYQVVQLLFAKNIDIFEEIKEKEYAMKFLNNIDVGVYQWGEKQENVLNEEEAFKAIVSYIHHRNFSTFGRILNYEKCLRLKQNIEQEMNKTEEDIYTFC